MIQLSSNSKYNIPLEAPPKLVHMKSTTLRGISEDKYTTQLCLMMYLSLNMPLVLYFPYTHAVVLYNGFPYLSWLLLFTGHPEILEQPVGDSVPVNRTVTLTCKASGIGTLVYSWERSSGSSWTTVSNDNTTSYTTDTTLAIGQYMYRCRVSNEAGSVVSNNAIVNVYGEYCPNM